VVVIVRTDVGQIFSNDARPAESSRIAGHDFLCRPFRAVANKRSTQAKARLKPGLVSFHGPLGRRYEDTALQKIAPSCSLSIFERLRRDAPSFLEIENEGTKHDSEGRRRLVQQFGVVSPRDFLAAGEDIGG
jgi:hypothetical protein